jgi:MFS family permease
MPIRSARPPTVMALPAAGGANGSAACASRGGCVTDSHAVPASTATTLFLQDGRGWSPLRMAFALLPVGLIVAVGSPLVGRLVDRFGTAPLIVTSMTSLTLGYVWFLATAGSSPDYALTMLPSLLLLGGGFAFGYSAITAQATEGIDDSEQGFASGLVQTSGQVGAALVLAVLTAVLAVAGDSGGDFTAYQPGLNLVTGVAADGLLLNLVPVLRLRRRRDLTYGKPPQGMSAGGSRQQSVTSGTW